MIFVDVYPVLWYTVNSGAIKFGGEEGMAEEKKKTTTKAKTKPKTKKCKHCKSDMPYAAKVCPTCGRRQGGGVLKIIMILILALVLIGVGIEIGTQTGQLDVKNNSGEQKNSDSENGQEEIGGDPNVEIIADYTLPDSIGWYTRRFMVVTNNSNRSEERRVGKECRL